MNKKLISKILKKKHEDFVSSIEDEEVRELVNKNSIITGGAIASMFLNEYVNDFDYYFTNKETVLAVANYYIKKFKESNDVPISVVDADGRIKIKVESAGIAGKDDAITGIEDMDLIPSEGLEIDKKKYTPVFLSSNAITLANKIQLIIRFYGVPEEIHNNYDFVHCTNYWLSENKKIFLNQPALESILSKNLYYIGSLYPVCSIIRTRKFIKRGWHINAGQYVKMCFQVSLLNLENISVLEDQLTGVDASYFHFIIEWFKKKKIEDETFEITTPYLISVIDRIFN